jgi:hypothetical protein
MTSATPRGRSARGASRGMRSRSSQAHRSRLSTALPTVKACMPNSTTPGAGGAAPSASEAGSSPLGAGDSPAGPGGLQGAPPASGLPPPPAPKKPAAEAGSGVVDPLPNMSPAPPTRAGLPGPLPPPPPPPPPVVCTVSRKWPWRQAAWKIWAARACAHTSPVRHSAPTTVLYTTLSGRQLRARICSKAASARRQWPARSCAAISPPKVTESGRHPLACIASNSSCARSHCAPWAQAAMSEL